MNLDSIHGTQMFRNGVNDEAVVQKGTEVAVVGIPGDIWAWLSALMGWERISDV